MQVGRSAGVSIPWSLASQKRAACQPFSLLIDNKTQCMCILEPKRQEAMCKIIISWVSWFIFIFFANRVSFLSFQGVNVSFFGWDRSLLWCSWKENAAAQNQPSQSITTNTNKAQSESAQLKYLSAEFLPAPCLLVKQQQPDARINVATNNCNTSDCERCHALPDALLRGNGMLM